LYDDLAPHLASARGRIGHCPEGGHRGLECLPGGQRWQRAPRGADAAGVAAGRRTVPARP